MKTAPRKIKGNVNNINLRMNAVSLILKQRRREQRYTVKKKVCEFPVPSRDVTTKLSLGGNNDVITELFLPRGSLVSDIPAGDGKLVNLFSGVYITMPLSYGI
jgi:hypothetical protein